MKLVLVILSVFCCLGLQAQADTLPQPPPPPFKKFTGVPPFKLLLADSSYFTKDDLARKKSVLIMVFSPDCEHCKHQTGEIIRNIDAFKKTEIVMATMLPFEKVKEFYDHYELKRFDNIKVGKDATYLLPGFYNVHSLPFLAFYNKKKELISVSDGSMTIGNVIAELAK